MFIYVTHSFNTGKNLEILPTTNLKKHPKIPYGSTAILYKKIIVLIIITTISKSMKSFTKKGFLIHFSSLFARAGEPEPEPLEKKRGAGAGKN